MSTKIHCPVCNHHSFYSSDDSFWYCFYCGYQEAEKRKAVVRKRSPNIVKFRALYKELAEYYHSCLQTEHRAYLNERGIQDSTIDRLKLGYCPESSHLLYTHPLAEEAGISVGNNPFLANRLTFPYIVNKKVIDIRGRLFSGEGEKYVSLRFSAYTRGADYAYGYHGTVDTVILTEGEIKQIIAEQEGYLIEALPGITNYRETAQADKSIICFDSQKDKYGVHRAIRRLAARVNNPYVATLPLRGKEKQDIDSYILNYGSLAFKSVITSAIPFDEWSKYA